MIPGPRDSLLYLRGPERYMGQGKFSSCLAGMASHTIPKDIPKGKGGCLDTGGSILGHRLPTPGMHSALRMGGSACGPISLQPSSA